MSEARDLLQKVVEKLVDHPGKVIVTELNFGKKIVLKLSVHSDDIRFVFGKRRSILNAIDLLLSKIVKKNGKFLSIVLID